MHITDTEYRALARRILRRAPGAVDPNSCDFTIRPISEVWRAKDRSPAYRTAVANVAYIWRDSTPVDRYGLMPRAFAERRPELYASGLMLPQSAPAWAMEPYTIWQAADDAVEDLIDIAEVRAWHVLMQIPQDIPRRAWTPLVTGFVNAQLTSKGAAVAWAIHALEADDGSWHVAPHAHLVLSARQWRRTAKQGQRMAAWAGYTAAQARLGSDWRSRCRKALSMRSIGWI